MVILNSSTILNNIVTYTAVDGLTFLTDDISKVGTFVIKVLPSLTSYPSTIGTQMDMFITLEACSVSSIETPKIDEIEIDPDE